MQLSFDKSFLLNMLKIENFIKKYYAIHHTYSAIDHLITQEELKKLQHNPQNRAAVFLLKENDQTFISIYFSQDIQTVITRNNPRSQLNHRNLDAFCVLVEEISHFHLLLTRALHLQQAREVELEWQAEIDKLLVAHHLLEQQNGDNYANYLFKILFNETNTVLQKTSYQDANLYAQRFWLKNRRKLKSRAKKTELNNDLKELYYKDWQVKYKACG